MLMTHVVIRAETRVVGRDFVKKSMRFRRAPAAVAAVSSPAGGGDTGDTG